MAKGSITNLTVTNVAQQQQTGALQLKMTQSANNVGQVMYCLPVQQPMMQMQMPNQQQHRQGRGGRGGGRSGKGGGGRGGGCGRNNSRWQEV